MESVFALLCFAVFRVWAPVRALHPKFLSGKPKGSVDFVNFQTDRRRWTWSNPLDHQQLNGQQFDPAAPSSLVLRTKP